MLIRGVRLRDDVFVLTMIVGVAAGCGSEVLVVEDGDGGSGALGNGGGTSTNVGGAGATGGGGAGGVCTPFLNEPPEDSVSVEFRNDSGIDIYLPTICGDPVFQIVPVGGEDGTDYNYDKSCLQTCQHLQSGDPIVCADCAPLSLLIPAGETRVVPWNGVGLEPGYTMPGQCLSDGGSGDVECARIVNAPAGEYRADAVGYAECGPDCECDEKGLCFGQAQGLEAYPDITKFEHPGDNTVEVVFGVCAFPCPG